MTKVKIIRIKVVFWNLFIFIFMSFFALNLDIKFIKIKKYGWNWNLITWLDHYFEKTTKIRNGKNQNFGSVLFKVLCSLPITDHRPPFVRKQYFIIVPMNFLFYNFSYQQIFSTNHSQSFERYFHSIEWRQFILPMI